MCQSWDFKVAEEVLDVWRQLRGSLVVVAGAPSWDKSIGLLHYLKSVRYRFEFGERGKERPGLVLFDYLPDRDR